MTEKIKTLLNGAIVSMPRASFHLELDGDRRGGAAFLSGINGIRELTDTLALFRARGFLVKIVGKRLLLSVFENRAIRIEGLIEGVELIYDKA